MNKTNVSLIKTTPMNKSTMSVWSMMLRCQNFLNTNAALVDTIVDIDPTRLTIFEKMAEISSLKEIQESTTKGFTFDKSRLRAQLTGTVLVNGAMVTSYAAASGNGGLQAEIKSCMRQLNTCSATRLLTKAGTVHAKIQANLPALASRGRTAATQTALQTDIDNFKAAISAPREFAVKKAEATKLIEVGMKSVNANFTILDDLVGSLLGTNPDFVAEYKRNRMIVNSGNVKRAAICKVLSLSSNQPLEKAELDTPFGKFRSSKNGNVIIRSATEGTYTIKVSRPGSQTRIYTLTIINGLTTKETFYLEDAA